MKDVFFNNWDSVLRTAYVGVIGYFALIVMLRISGKRTLSQMKQFDFIVTVALGSVLATTLLSKTLPLADGVTALFVLITLQYLLAAGSVRSKKFANLISSEPTLIFFKGSFLSKALKKERVTEEEVRSVLRAASVTNLAEIDAVVIESNGKFSVVKKGSMDDQDSPLFNVKRAE